MISLRRVLRQVKETVIKKMYTGSVVRYFTRTNDAMLTDPGIHVIMVGTGSPMYDRIRNPQCIALIAGGRFLVFDTGDGCTRTMESLHLPLTKISHVFLTHFHSDHTNGLGHLISYTWENGRKNPMHVYGPPGVEQVVRGFAESAAPDIAIRSGRSSVHPIDPIGGVGIPHTFTYPEDGTAVVIWRENGLVVKAFRNDHADIKISVGYRIEYAGRVVVVSGDTIQCPFVVQNSVGADILIHEVVNKKLVLDITDVMDQKFGADGKSKAAKIRNVIKHHSNTRDVAKVARDARVAKLVLTHIVPGIPDNPILKYLFTEGMSKVYTGPICLAKDGDQFYLPPKNSG